MHKIVRSNESSIPSKQCYFSRVEDQNLRFQGAVSSPVNRIRAQFELHTLQFYGIGLARTSLDKAISDTKQGEKWRGRSVNLTERGKGAAAFEWRDPDLSARNRDVPYNWKQPKVFRLRSTLIGGHHLGKQIDRAQIIIAAISSKSHRDHPRFPTSNRGIEFISESRKKFHAYEKSVSDSNRDGTRRHWRKIGEYFFFIFLLFFFFFYFFYYYYYLLSKEGEERKEGRKNKKKGKKLRVHSLLDGFMDSARSHLKDYIREGPRNERGEIFLHRDCSDSRYPLWYRPPPTLVPSLCPQPWEGGGKGKLRTAVWWRCVAGSCRSFIL